MDRVYHECGEKDAILLLREDTLEEVPHKKALLFAGLFYVGCC
jgi:hypothetical protein